MVFGVILAGGIGSRMGNVEKPKQYLNLGGKPVIIHTVEKFFVNKNFDEVIILCPPSWIGHTKNLVKKYLNNDKKIVVIEGGETRNETIMASVTYIEKKYGVTDDTIIVTHDAVRPFVTHRILEENIQAAREYGACDTVVSAADTIVQRTEEGHMIADIPDRRRMCQGQTPQSFQAAKIRKLYNSLLSSPFFSSSSIYSGSGIFVSHSPHISIPKTFWFLIIIPSICSNVPSFICP